jgi:hypothetical protein
MVDTKSTDAHTRAPTEAQANAAAGPHGDPGRAEAAETEVAETGATAGDRPAAPQQKPGEIGGPKGPEPTRYGDWEVNGRCSDF